MLKMVLDPMGGIVLTNDGNAILRFLYKQYLLLDISSSLVLTELFREIDVAHPAAKSMIELRYYK
jgi:T-complex protein 1 subunit gamma